MKIALAQVNPIVGDVGGNTERLLHILRQLAAERVDLIIFPELFICGYPPKDLLERNAFLAAIDLAINRILKESRHYPETGILFGAPIRSKKTRGKGLSNAAILVHNGFEVARVAKRLLPTYDVFDEHRYFDPADEQIPIEFKGERLGISICEDAWNDPEMWYRPIYSVDPIADLAHRGATMLINLSASPFSVGKERIRYRLLRNHVERHRLPLIFVNQVGGNDELIFDGTSFVFHASGELLAQLPSFEQQIKIVDLKESEKVLPFSPKEEIEAIHDALVLGLKDYVRKCGFDRVLIGLSGGIDSAVTCALAVRALGPDKVWGVTMPSQYSSTGSVEDSRKLARNLGIRFDVVPIKQTFHAYLDALAPLFGDQPPDITEENIQARIRGNYLMALSNKFGHLVLSTGNKSELAMGYCTLYGDMSGGLAVISDVPKTIVYRLAHFINQEREVIPKAILTKAPSAELRPNQTDQDSLPPYEILDGILEAYITEGKSAEEIIQAGFSREVVYDVIRTVDRNEYKRRQAAPGLKVTSKAFGSGRRMPIAARFVDSWG